MMLYKKIAVVGIGASGKSTLSRFLSKRTGLPIFHLDTFLWKGNWRSVPKDDYLMEHETAVKKRKWIIEGYVDKEMAERLKMADLILYLDYSGILCFSRAIRRWWRHRKHSRPELPADALDEFDLAFFLRILVRSQRKDIEEALSIGKPIRVIRFRSQKDLDEFIMNEFGFGAASLRSAA